jgi:hypothetical protein
MLPVSYVEMFSSAPRSEILYSAFGCIVKFHSRTTMGKITLCWDMILCDVYRRPLSICSFNFQNFSVRWTAFLLGMMRVSEPKEHISNNFFRYGA